MSWWVATISMLADKNYHVPYYGPFLTFEEARGWHSTVLTGYDLWVISHDDMDNPLSISTYVYDNSEAGYPQFQIRADGTLLS